MNDMNELRSHELEALDAMNKLGLQLTWTTTGHEFRALDGMKAMVSGWHELLRIMSWGL